MPEVVGLSTSTGKYTCVKPNLICQVIVSLIRSIIININHLFRHISNDNHLLFGVILCIRRIYLLFLYLELHLLNYHKFVLYQCFELVVGLVALIYVVYDLHLDLHIPI